MNIHSSKLLAVTIPVLLLAGACDKPLDTSPGPPPVQFKVSGIVTDDGGAPVVGAKLELSYVHGGTTTTTDTAGRYEFNFGIAAPQSGPARLVVFADGYDHNMQFVELRQTTVENMVVRQARRITAGESSTVAVDANSSTCYDLEEWLIYDHLCAQIHVVATANGTLLVDARPVQDAGDVPTVFSGATGNYRQQILGPGTVTLLEVRAGASYHIYVGAPQGMVSQQYAVTTSMQTAAGGGVH